MSPWLIQTFLRILPRIWGSVSWLSRTIWVGWAGGRRPQHEGLFFCFTYVGETLAAVEAQSLETTVAQHLDDLGVLLAVLLEGQLTTLIIVLLGTTSAVLATLCEMRC